MLKQFHIEINLLEEIMSFAINKSMTIGPK